jgi:stringent starvation protein B
MEPLPCARFVFLNRIELCMTAPETTSTRPYLVRALHEWCTDNGLTPYMAVRVDGSVQVPREFVKDGEIVLNVSYDATNALRLGNDYIEFKARFGGKLREIIIPVERVIAVYARENGQGMAFPQSEDSVDGELDAQEVLELDEEESDASVSDAGDGSAEAQAKQASPAGASPEDKVIQLVTSDSHHPDGGGAPTPPPSGGSRPSLKLVK